MTDKHHNYLESLSEIRNLMDRSSRFISLSGLAGVAAGVWALGGALAAYYILKSANYPCFETYTEGIQVMYKLVGVALLVLLLAVSSGIYFTTRKAKKQGHTVWDKKVLNLVFNIAVPLGAGGLFCLFLLYLGFYYLVPPATLIFYGLSLFCAGNYTHKDVKQLGLAEIALGFGNLFFIKNEYVGLCFWAFGFGILHIVYGILMYTKYEKNEAK
jgi:hypothetical protein